MTVDHVLRDDDCWLPDEEDISTNDGLVSNKAYLDLRCVKWKFAREVLNIERSIIAKAPHFPDDSDTIHIVMPGEPYPYDLFLDTGVASTVCALAASGAIPTSSCNAGQLGGDHFESRVLVAFFAPKHLAEPLTLAAKIAEVTFGTVYIDLGPVNVVYSRTIENMMRFADALWDVH